MLFNHVELLEAYFFRFSLFVAARKLSDLFGRSALLVLTCSPIPSPWPSVQFSEHREGVHCGEQGVSPTYRTGTAPLAANLGALHQLALHIKANRE